MNSLLLYQIAVWLNGVSLAVFLAIEIFWFVKENKGPRDIPTLLLGFIIYNLPFLLLALSMSIQAIPEGWTGILRLVFLLICIPFNLWLHYHGDKGGNSVGMMVVFFLMGAVPLVLIIEVFVAFY
jgi:hypothetical protein